jgi:hypothetical protein
VTSEALKVRIIESRRPASSLRGKEVIKSGRLTDKRLSTEGRKARKARETGPRNTKVLKKMRLVSVKTKKKGSVDVI